VGAAITFIAPLRDVDQSHAKDNIPDSNTLSR